MNFGVTFLNGLCLGSGMIVAAFLMEYLFKIGFCGA